MPLDEDAYPAAADALETTVCDLLITEGPTPVADVIDLVDETLLDHLRADDFADDFFPELFVEELVAGGRIWATHDDVLVCTEDLLDGVTLTHRLTAEEIEFGAVAMCPDLTLLDWNDLDNDAFSAAGLSVDDGPAVPGENLATVRGAKGWLDAYSSGDLIAFSLRDGVVTHRSVAEGDLVDDTAFVDGLRRGAANWIRPGSGSEVDPVLLDALVAAPDALVAPVRPVDALMTAAGFERRGFLFGRVGDDWGADSPDRHRARIIERWDLDDCCVEAFDVAKTAFVDYVTALDTTDDAEEENVDDAGPVVESAVENAEFVAEALLHGDVADAFAEHILEVDVDAPALASFGMAVASGAPRAARAGAHLVAALGHERAGAGAAADAALRAARSADPDFGPAALHLVDYEVDRGALGAAITLLHHPDVAPDDRMAAVLESHRRELDDVFRDVGRNDPCPCGSGRKFKQCCQDGPVPLRHRTRLLSLKLARFALRREAREQLIELAAAGVATNDLRAVATLAQDPVVIDISLFEGGRAAEYLAARGALLPPDERALVAALLDTPRAVYEVVAVEPGVSLVLRDTRRADEVTVDDRIGSKSAMVGTLLWARVVPVGAMHQLFGIPVAVPLSRGDDVQILAEADPPLPAEALVSFYAATRQP